MSYSSILKQLVIDSNLTYNQIIEECKKYGTSIDKSYLSKLVNGKISPPSNDISHALEKVLNIQTDALVVEAYFDKAPKQIKHFIKRTRDDIFSFAMAEVGIDDSEDEALSAAYREEFDKQPIINFLPTPTNLKNKTVPNVGFYYDNGIEFEITINDDGFTPIIPKGANITTERCDEYKNGDILAVKVDLDDSIIVRKYYELSDTNIILLPVNINYEPIVITNGFLVILGKVVSYEVKLN